MRHRVSGMIQVRVTGYVDAADEDEAREKAESLDTSSIIYDGFLDVYTRQDWQAEVQTDAIIEFDDIEAEAGT